MIIVDFQDYITRIDDLEKMRFCHGRQSKIFQRVVESFENFHELEMQTKKTKGAVYCPLRFAEWRLLKLVRYQSRV